MSRRKPEDTSKRPPSVHLLGAMAMGSSNYIQGMEAEGQRQLVNSLEIPRDWRGFKEDLLKEMGFYIPPSLQTDRGDIFRPADLPNGWSKKGSDHAMWSYLVDEKGFRRFSIFYKAAFYDRSAHIGVERRFRIVRDYDAPDDTMTYTVEAAMPNGERKVIYTFTHEKKIARNDSADATQEERTAYWDARDAIEKECGEACTSWLTERFPDPFNPTKHWDAEL